MGDRQRQPLGGSTIFHSGKNNYDFMIELSLNNS
jgi:hypothetical protein